MSGCEPISSLTSCLFPTDLLYSNHFSHFGPFRVKLAFYFILLALVQHISLKFQ